MIFSDRNEKHWQIKQIEKKQKKYKVDRDVRNVQLIFFLIRWTKEKSGKTA